MEPISEAPVNNGEKMENSPVRDEKGRIVSGVLNPNGKPKGTRHLSTMLETMLEELAEGSKDSYKVLLNKRVIKKAIADGDDRMIEHIWDRIEGKPPQKIENTNIEVPYDSLSDEEKASLKSLL